LDLIDEDGTEIATSKDMESHQQRDPCEVAEPNKNPNLEGSCIKQGIKDYKGIIRPPIKILSTETKKGSATVETIYD